MIRMIQMAISASVLSYVYCGLLWYFYYFRSSESDKGTAEEILSVTDRAAFAHRQQLQCGKTFR